MEDYKCICGELLDITNRVYDEIYQLDKYAHYFCVNPDCELVTTVERRAH